MRHLSVAINSTLMLAIALAVVPANSVAAQPSAPTGIPLVTGGVGNFLVGPLGQYIVYDVDVTPAGFIAKEWLYAVPRAGGAPVQLDALMADLDLNCAAFEIAPDESFVVFLGVPFTNQTATHGYWRAPINGGPSTLITPVTATTVFSSGSDGTCELPFRLAPDGTRLVYETLEPNSTQSLRSALTNGGGSVVLSSDLRNSSTKHLWEISPSGTHVAYVATRAPSEVSDNLSIVPISGPASSTIRLGASSLLESSGVAQYQFSPDGSRILFYQAGGPWMTQVWTALPNGSGRVLLFENATRAMITPDGERVVWVSSLPLTVASAPIAGPAAATITQTVPGALGGDGSFVDGGKRLVVSADMSAPMYVITLDGSVPAVALPTGGHRPYSPGPLFQNERFVFWRTDPATGQPAVFSARSTGPDFDVRQLTPPLSDMLSFPHWDHRVPSARYRYADLGRVLVYEDLGIRLVPLHGSGSRLVVAASSDIDWLLTPDARHVVYKVAGALYTVDLFAGCSLASTVPTQPAPPIPPSGLLLFLPSVSRCM